MPNFEKLNKLTYFIDLRFITQNYLRTEFYEAHYIAKDIKNHKEQRCLRMKKIQPDCEPRTGKKI